MPSPLTPARTAIRRDTKTPPSKTKSTNGGTPLGLYDTNSVQDRVRQWQSQGGGVITAPDIYIEDDDEEEKFARKNESPENEGIKASSKTNVDRTPPQRRKGGRKVKIDGEVRDRNRSGSAPAKRVVSDAHWRTKRSPPRSPTTSKTLREIPPKHIFVDDGIRVKPIPDPNTDVSRKSDGTMPVRKKKNIVEYDDGIRVFVTPPKSRRRSGNLQAQKQDERIVPNEKNSDSEILSSKSPGSRVASSIKHPTPEKTTREESSSGREKSRRQESNHQKEKTQDVEPLSSPCGSSATKDKARRRNSSHQKEKPKHVEPVSSPDGLSATQEKARRRKSSHQKERPLDIEPLSTPGGFSEGRGSPRSHRGNLLSQVFGDSRKIFSKAQPVPIAAPRVPSIEAWLDETSDPFLDEVEPCIENPPPLEPSLKSPSFISEKTPAKDPNKIWDSLGPSEGHRVALHGSRRRKRIRSSAIYEDNPFPASLDTGSPDGSVPDGTVAAPKLVDLVYSSPEGLSSSLRRRGATRDASSPGRDRRNPIVRNQPAVDNDESSTVSSLLTASSVEAPDPKFPLRPPGLSFKRPFPSTGQHRLSTIASVETFNTQVQGAPPASVSKVSEATIQPSRISTDDCKEEARDGFDLNSLEQTRSRLTKHADLISVLSLPQAGSKSIVSARSIRTNRSRLATATIGDLMKELATDESKYMRELRTLVDGVIPVLLSCVLSRSDSAVAAGLFRPTANFSNDPNFTKPIVDMGIALERLKTLHKRIPSDDFNAFLTWAHGAQRVYTEYLKAWRMGFEDVVVNLAPAVEASSSGVDVLGTDPDGLDAGLPRNKDGDVVDGDGERVDVAFLLKRPLVRLKYLSKTLKGINFISPSAEAEGLANKYQNLVIDARNRSNEERARLEDEAASNIDPTRARDPHTLAPLKGVTIDKTRHVRARDHFNLALPHSSGQCMDCRVELLLRDEANGVGTAGDLLICEVDSTGRWLLFPPVQSGRVSARNGDLKGEIVVMIRGFGASGVEWQELLFLRSDDEQAGFEWVKMLGLTPVPPKIMRSQSFVSRHSRKKSSSETKSSTLEPPAPPASPVKSRTPSPREVDIPIGEQANSTSKPWAEAPVEKGPISPSIASLTRDTVKFLKKLPNSLPSTPSKLSYNYANEVNDLRSLPSQASTRRPCSWDQTQMQQGLDEALDSMISTSPSTLKRTKAKRLSKHAISLPTSPKAGPVLYTNADASTPSTNSQIIEEPRLVPSIDAIDHRSLSPEPILDFDPHSRKAVSEQRNDSTRPPHHRSPSSLPSLELPTIPKIRANSPSTAPINDPDEEPIWAVADEPTLKFSPTKLTKKQPTIFKTKVDKAIPQPLNSKAEDSSPPPPPRHGLPSPVELKGSKPPVLEAKSFRDTKRRSSSPLKHEYEPSTASESFSDSETSTVEHNEVTSMTDSSEDELETSDVPTPLLPLNIVQPSIKASPQGSIYSLPNGTLSPSQSASQAPYKTVPPQPTKASKTIASIFSWSDKGAWQSLHPDECSIVITPGLIEAYEMSAAHSKVFPLSSSTPIIDADAFSDLSSNLITPEESCNERPLVALELTPLVPLRRGTALDISIRSPPTLNSKITSGNNIMFRSRNPEECEALYALINHSRINNPTYVALQNARGPFLSGSSFSSFERRNSTRTGGSRASSWFGSWGGSSGYRSSSVPTPSIALSESSIGSMASAFSALKRFGKGGSGFNIARSSISSRNGSRANSVYTSSDNSSGSGTNSPIPPGVDVANRAGPIGLSNAKIRLYTRETASRWRDMGAARLTIMRPSSPALTEGSVDNRPHVPGRADKRIVINGKTKGEVLLDVQLGESCFERVARTGIALSVWEDVVGPNGEVGTVGAVGGVGGGRARVYMIQVSDSWIDSFKGGGRGRDALKSDTEKMQRLRLLIFFSGNLQMKSEAETAYTFSIVGKLRY